MLMLALRLILKDKGGKQHCLPFADSNLEVEIFLKKREYQKRMRWNRGLRHLCILCIGVSRKFYLLFYCFLLIKKILKALFSFIPWLLDFFDLPSHGTNSRKWYTLRLLSMCLEKSTASNTGGTVQFPPFILSLIPLDGLFSA